MVVWYLHSESRVANPRLASFHVVQRLKPGDPPGLLYNGSNLNNPSQVCGGGGGRSLSAVVVPDPVKFTSDIDHYKWRIISFEVLCSRSPQVP